MHVGQFVRLAIKLDDEHALEASEVGEEPPDRPLSAELVAAQPSVAELRPQERLDFG